MVPAKHATARALAAVLVGSCMPPCLRHEKLHGPVLVQSQSKCPTHHAPCRLRKILQEPPVACLAEDDERTMSGHVVQHVNLGPLQAAGYLKPS